MMISTGKQWWYLQWNGDDMYSETMSNIYSDGIYNEMMMVFMMEHWWYLQWNMKQYIQKMNFKILPPPPNLLLWFNYEFSCGTLARPGWRRFLPQTEHTSLTPRCSFLTWALIGSPWGWWALFATFNLALIHMLCAPPLYSNGLHMGQYVSLWSWSGSWRGRHCGLACRIWSFRSCGLLRGQLGNGGTGS